MSFFSHMSLTCKANIYSFRLSLSIFIFLPLKGLRFEIKLKKKSSRFYELKNKIEM